jgi:hypothetical protein
MSLGAFWFPQCSRTYQVFFFVWSRANGDHNEGSGLMGCSFLVLSQVAVLEKLLNRLLASCLVLTTPENSFSRPW